MKQFVKSVPSPEKKEPPKQKPVNPKDLGKVFVEGARADLKAGAEQEKNKVREQMEKQRKEDEELLKTLGAKASLF